MDEHSARARNNLILVGILSAMFAGVFLFADNNPLTHPQSGAGHLFSVICMAGILIWGVATFRWFAKKKQAREMLEADSVLSALQVAETNAGNAVVIFSVLILLVLHIPVPSAWERLSLPADIFLFMSFLMAVLHLAFLNMLVLYELKRDISVDD